MTICIFASILLGGWRFLHYIVQDVPLGYDAGIYRQYFTSVYQLLPEFDMQSLSKRLQNVFPPFLGILATYIKLLGITGFDRLLTWGVGVQSALVSIALYFFVSAKNKTLALVVALLSWISFVQYEVFWRNYMKQLLGMFFLLMTLGLWQRERRWLSFPLVLALAATHRPALLVLVGVTVLWCGMRLLDTIQQRKNTGMRSYTGLQPVGILVTIGVLTGICHLWLYPGFISQQIGSLFARFVSSIDVPTLQDSYQAGGTFLTMFDLFKTNWHILVLSCIGFAWTRKEKQWRWMQLGYVFLSIWVFAQFSFYQRMIGYADLFWIIFAGVALIKLWTWKPKTGIIFAALFFVYHAGSFAWWVEQTWRPIMVAEELDFFQTLPEILPDDAIVMNTYNLYSPWLLGWGERPTISPGLRGIDVRIEQDWYDYRRESNGPTKCRELQKAYGKKFQNIYIWQGSKQWPNDFEGADCLRIWKQSTNEKIPWVMYLRQAQEIEL